MERYSTLGKGWLGPMHHGCKDGKDYRVHNIEKISLSLREDLNVRQKFFDAIQHPNIPPLFSLQQGVMGTVYRPAVTVEYIIQQGGFGDEELLNYFVVCVNNLLSMVHAQGWIHGDLHPDLIYLTESGEVVVEGFGREPQKTEYPHTGHHRYLPPEPFGSISSDLYGLGVIALELALGEHVILGDLLEDSHEQKIARYIQGLSDKNSVSRSFIERSLHFNPERRKEASFVLLPLLEKDIPAGWNEFCTTHVLYRSNYTPELTDPMDIVFHTEEDINFPDIGEITKNELTEDLLPDIPVRTSIQPPNLEHVINKSHHKILIVILALIVLLIILINM